MKFKFILIFLIALQNNIFTLDNDILKVCEIKRKIDVLGKFFYASFIARKLDSCVNCLNSILNLYRELGCGKKFDFNSPQTIKKLKSTIEDAEFFELIKNRLEERKKEFFNVAFKELICSFNQAFVEKKDEYLCLKIMNKIIYLFNQFELPVNIDLSFKEYAKINLDLLKKFFKLCEENDIGVFGVIPVSEGQIIDAENKLASEKINNNFQKKKKKVRSKKQLIIYDKYGRTELQNAIRNGHLNQVIAYLKGNGSNYFDVLTKDSKLHALHYAVDRCQNVSTDESKKILEELVKFAKANGKNLDVVTSNGYTPLHIAACNGNLEVVEFLINNGADYRLLTNEKLCAKDLALNRRKNDEFLKYFNELESPD